MLALPMHSFATINHETMPIKVELISEEKTIQPGRPFWIALRFVMDDGWHVYWKNPGEAGIPLKVDWKLPEGLRVGPLKWPFPEKFTVEGMVGFGYQREVTLLTEITPDPSLKSGEEIHLDALVTWLVCSSLICQPGSASVQFAFQVDSQHPQPNENVVNLFQAARAKIPTSHVAIKTVRKEGLVQLQVPTSSTPQGAIVDAYFFPEQANIIDHSVDPTVSQTISPSDKFVVNLKENDEIGAKSAILKGVLVVHTQKDAYRHIQAFDIDSLIQDNTDRYLVSFANSSKNPSFVSASIGNSIISSPIESRFQGGLGLALFFAFLGGMILNLMPCVLPVLSFKVMSFVKMAGQNRLLTIKHGLLFTLGVLFSFWILAIAMLFLRAYGQAVGWGFQLQEPLFVVILASVLFIFSLNLFGVFEWGVFFASWAGQTQADTSQKSSGYVSSFLSGVLATAVATPCTGPFLGSAVGFAVTLPVFQALLIFTVLGLGMCCPYLLLSAFPACFRFIPKPGPWMEIFKECMGFLLLATVLWLMWVFSAQTDSFSLICLIGGFLCFAIGAWLYGKGSSPLISKSRRMLAYISVSIFVIIGCQMILFPRGSWYSKEALSSERHLASEWDGWENFSPERVALLQKQGIPVLIDFTAKWCLICQANHLVLSAKAVSQRLAEAGVVKMKADWTKSDPMITRELSKFGRTSVPLYVLYGTDPNSQPFILPQVLTQEIVIEHLKFALEPEQIALE